MKAFKKPEISHCIWQNLSFFCGNLFGIKIAYNKIPQMKNDNAAKWYVTNGVVSHDETSGLDFSLNNKNSKMIDSKQKNKILVSKFQTKGSMILVCSLQVATILEDEKDKCLLFWFCLVFFFFFFYSMPFSSKRLKKHL